MPQTLTIEINELHLRATHGVLPQERIVGNDFVITVHLLYPAGDAIANDRLQSTLNYAEAVDIIRGVMATPSDLLEHVCGRIRAALLSRFPLIEGGMIRVAKPAPPIPSAKLSSVAATLRW